MKKHFSIPVIICIASVVINLIVLTVSYNYNTKTDNKGSEKISLIIDKIQDRGIVEEDYFRYIENEETIEKIKRYNTQTSELYLGYVGYSVEALYAIKNSDEDKSDAQTSNYHLSEEDTQIIGSIARYALYRNATELLLTDYQVATLISKEQGSSYGAWPWHIHDEPTILTATGLDKDTFDSYFTLVNEILESLKNEQ